MIIHPSIFNRFSHIHNHNAFRYNFEGLCSPLPYHNMRIAGLLPVLSFHMPQQGQHHGSPDYTRKYRNRYAYQQRSSFVSAQAHSKSADRSGIYRMPLPLIHPCNKTTSECHLRSCTCFDIKAWLVLPTHVDFCVFACKTFGITMSTQINIVEKSM